VQLRAIEEVNLVESLLTGYSTGESISAAPEWTISDCWRPPTRSVRRSLRDGIAVVA
jgi:hypothetical protein